MWLLIPLLVQLGAPAPEAASAFELRWHAPSECPDDAAVRGAVEHRLGRALAPPLGDGLSIELRAGPQADRRWRVALDVRSRDGHAHRELADATDCAAAVEAAALVIAIAIDPELAAAVPEPAPGPPAADATNPAAVAAGATATPAGAGTKPAPAAEATPAGRGGPTPTEATAAPRSRTRAAVGATAAASLGELRRVGVHGRAFVAVLRPRVRFELGGSYGAAPTWKKRDASVDMARWTVDARACPVIAALAWLELLPCLGVEAGQTLTRSEGLVGGARRDDAWAAGIAAPTLAFVPRRWLAVRLGVEMRVPFTRRDYTVLHAGRVHRTTPVTGALVAGLELRFP
jgi:hypothetical protein